MKVNSESKKLFPAQYEETYVYYHTADGFVIHQYVARVSLKSQHITV